MSEDVKWEDLEKEALTLVYQELVTGEVSGAQVSMAKFVLELAAKYVWAEKMTAEKVVQDIQNRVNPPSIQIPLPPDHNFLANPTIMIDGVLVPGDSAEDKK